MQVLCQADWKDDNISGLRGTLEQLAVSHPGQLITANDISLEQSRKPVTNAAAEDAREQADLCLRFVDALSKNPGCCSRDECRQLIDELDGAFPELLAYILAWSLRL